MSSYNPFNNLQQIGMSTTVDNKGFFNINLRKLSKFGMDYDDMILRNQVGIGINEDPSIIQDTSNSMYAFMSQKAIASVLDNKAIPYLDRSSKDKKRILREYSIKDRLRDFIEKICDECIIYDEDNDFCKPKMLSTDYSSDIHDKYQESFEKIYHAYGFADNITAWNMMKDFLIDGTVAVEIVWDDKKKNIIYFNKLDPGTIIPSFDPSVGNLWLQYPEDPQHRRIFLDSQIVFISYSAQNDYSQVSYLEGLIKPYNQLTILEQTRIMFNILNAMIFQKFTIPTKGIPPNRAEEEIAKLISNYSEEMQFDDEYGTIQVRGRKHLPFQKQLWFPDGESGTPNFELVSPTGHNLNEDDMLKWFENNLRRASKIPFNRFDTENGGGSLMMDAASMTRDEISFSSFLNRLRAIYKELIVKPLKLQMCMEFPELRSDIFFLNQIDVVFNSNQLFEEWKKMANFQKRIELLNTYTGVQRIDGTPYFHHDYLIANILKLSKEEIDENEAYWIKSGDRDKISQGDGNIGADTPGDVNFGSETTGSDIEETGMSGFAENPENMGGLEPGGGEDTSTEGQPETDFEF